MKVTSEHAIPAKAVPVKKDKKDVVLGMIERGGKLRLVPVKDATADLTRGYCASQSRTSSATVRACSTQEPMEGSRR